MRLFILLTFLSLSKGNNDWDLLIFTQHWPTTACLDYEESNVHHYCERPKVKNSWTVHGVWPTKLHTIGPGYCDSSLKFNVTSLKNLYGDLLNVWPNLEGGKTDDSLWDHEWTKHGTCAVSLESLDTEEKYFKKGLEWFGIHNMTTILARSGIMPSDTVEYDVRAIHDAIFKVTGTNPNIQCIHEKHTKKPYLFEIRVCFSKELLLVDCDGTLLRGGNVLTNCPTGETIKYPVHARGAVTFFPVYTASNAKRYAFARTIRTVVRILRFLDWIV